MQHEEIAQKLPQLHFNPEGYVSPSDVEFMDQFFSMLRSNGYDPEGLVFSGLDGTKFARGEPVPRYQAIFAMNEAGWKKAIKTHYQNPAQYAEGWETPCIGLYDKQQLAQVYSADHHIEDVNERFELSGIKLGEALADLPAGEPVEEAVAHRDYPNGSPTDALVGLVFIDE